MTCATLSHSACSKPLKGVENTSTLPRKLPQQEGEKVVEEMSTLDALECLGVCPANFEWFELNVPWRRSAC